MKKHSKKTLEQLELEGDGVIENFFHLLWTRDPLFGTIPSIYVPHTVIIRYNEPVAWYFMKEGAIKKKTKSNLSKDHIKEVFLRNKSISGIVAVFMRYVFKHSSEDPDVIFEYYNEKEFVDFITKEWHLNCGILQQFIQPKGDKNYIIRANWSPQLCFFDKIEALTRIHDKRYDIYDRVFTVEAEKYHSTEGPLRGYVVPNKIQRICANVAQHVQNVSFESIMIARMTLHFKIDSNSRIWFLICTSLRLNHEGNTKLRTKVRGEPVELNYKPEDYMSKIKTPEYIKTSITKGKPINMHKTHSCVNCNVALEPDSVFEANYKTIIEGYEWDHHREKDRFKGNPIMRSNPSNIDELLEKFQVPLLDAMDNATEERKVTSLVPPLLKKIHPNLMDEMYTTLKNLPGFLDKITILCEDCLLNVQQSYENKLEAQKESRHKFRGTGRLKPESLRTRTEHTLKLIRINGELSNLMNFTKYSQSLKPKDSRPATTRPATTRNIRVKSSSDIAFLFSELDPSKNVKTIQSDDEVNLSVDSNSERPETGAESNRVQHSIKIAKLTTPKSIKAEKSDEETKLYSATSRKDTQRSLSIATSTKKTVIEDLLKRENSLTSTSGFLSARTRKSKPNIQAESISEFSGVQANNDLGNHLFKGTPKKKVLLSKKITTQSDNNTPLDYNIIQHKLKVAGNKSGRVIVPFRQKSDPKIGNICW